MQLQTEKEKVVAEKDTDGEVAENATISKPDMKTAFKNSGYDVYNKHTRI
jgi:hypothetical protein